MGWVITSQRRAHRPYCTIVVCRHHGFHAQKRRPLSRARAPRMWVVVGFQRWRHVPAAQHQRAMDRDAV